jgi:serine protease
MLGPVLGLAWVIGAPVPRTARIDAGTRERTRASTVPAGIEAPVRAGALTAARSAGATIPPGAREAGPGEAASYAPHEVVVQYGPSSSPRARAASARVAGAEDPGGRAGGGAEAGAGEQVEPGPHMEVLHLRPGVSVWSAVARLRGRPGVNWAVPNYIAFQSALPTPFIPDDPGAAGTPGGWERLQWNFAGEFGVNAPQAWADVEADGHGGGRGVVVAVLDTGVAYANHGRFRRSPDLGQYDFVAGRNFIGKSPFASDRNGHGTFVASTIAEATDNARGVTGLAYGARIMPLRVLNAAGDGEASDIAKGVVYAVNHHARVINLSLEFSSSITAADIPELTAALRYADRHGAVIVAAAGNEASTRVPYPARDRYVIAVGASTEHGCLASYSNYGHRVALVAPGGGADADLPGDPHCRPSGPPGRDIYQVTFSGSSPRRFGLPTGYEGTSMACPHVAAVAALIIASGVLGRHPTPTQIKRRLMETALPLGSASDHRDYGAGLVDAAAAVEPILISGPPG